jgi:hypothetical protein
MDKYLKAFQAAAQKKDSFSLAPNALLVEVVDVYKEYEQANSASSIIIADTAGNVNNADALKPAFARVLQAGDEAAAKPGDYILVGKNSIGSFSYFGKLKAYGEFNFGLTMDDEILMLWNGREGFDEYFDALMGELTNER